MPAPSLPYCDEYGRLSRRGFLGAGLASLLALGLPPQHLGRPAWLPQIALAPPHVGPRGDTLVCIFLRGGADGLNMAPPYGDDAYYALRPNLAIPRPDAAGVDKAVDLDGFFGLHPALARLEPIFRAGDLAFVHAAGSPDESRSHFVAQAWMEQAGGALYSGWLGRHLATLDTGNTSPLRAVGVDDMLPLSLAGAVRATAVPDPAAYHLAAAPPDDAALETLLHAIYDRPTDLLTTAAQQTLQALELMKRVTALRPGRVVYPAHPFSQALQVTARLIQADVGLEVACINLGGWDTHAAQGGVQGQMANLLNILAAGLAAFYEDMQPLMGGITLVAMSEFGRRAAENSSGGTDHGHGNALLVLGGQINGGRVLARWPGLGPEQLVGPGDLAITTDYRDVLGEILRRRLNNPLLDQVFPDYAVVEPGVVRSDASAA